MEQPVIGRQGVERRRRRDCGSIKAVDRDFELLGFVGEQYAVTVVQLGRLIERRLDTARSLRDRWKRAGWVDSAMLTTTAPSFVWLTGRGAEVGSSAFRVWQPNHGLAAHIQAVTDVRIHLERALRLGQWECERAVARRLAVPGGGFRGHLPDGVLHTSGGRIAIEVELTLKSRTRLREIVVELGRNYEQVWYFVPDRLEQALTGIAQEAPRNNVRVHRYAPIVVP